MSPLIVQRAGVMVNMIGAYRTESRLGRQRHFQVVRLKNGTGQPHYDKRNDTET